MKPFTRKLEILNHVLQSCSLWESFPSLLFEFIGGLYSLCSHVCCKDSEHLFDILKSGIFNVDLRFEFTYLFLHACSTCLLRRNLLIFLLIIFLFLIIFFIPLVEPKSLDFYLKTAPMTITVRLLITAPLYFLAIAFPIPSIKS
jgi:hypothetical protein